MQNWCLLKRMLAGMVKLRLWSYPQHGVSIQVSVGVKVSLNGVNASYINSLAMFHSNQYLIWWLKKIGKMSQCSWFCVVNSTWHLAIPCLKTQPRGFALDVGLRVLLVILILSIDYIMQVTFGGVRDSATRLCFAKVSFFLSYGFLTISRHATFQPTVTITIS